MQREAHSQRRRQRPWFGLERLLQRGGTGDRVGGTGKDGEAPVAFAPALDDHAVPLLDAGGEEGKDQAVYGSGGAEAITTRSSIRVKPRRCLDMLLPPLTG